MAAKKESEPAELCKGKGWLGGMLLIFQNSAVKQVSVDHFMVSKCLSRAIKISFSFSWRDVERPHMHTLYRAFWQAMVVSEWINEWSLFSFFSNNFRICWLFLERNSVGRNIPEVPAGTVNRISALCDGPTSERQWQRLLHYLVPRSRSRSF